MRRLFLLAFATALTTVPAFAVPTSPSDHGLFDNGAFPPPASGILTHMDLSSALSSYVTQTALNTALDGYLPLTGGTLTGPVSGGYYIPACYTPAAIKSLPTPTGATISCFLDPNNGNQPNLALYALGGWHWIALGGSL